MPASMRIDQAGLPVGTPGQARTDGLDTGALVTLTSVGGGTTHRFRLLWVPPEDTTAVSTLTQTGPATWTFSPTPGARGTYRIELVVDEGTPSESRQRRIFGIRLPLSGLLVPAANEGADARATLLNAGPATIDRSENNEPFGPFASGSSWGWWKSWRDLYLYVESLVVGGGITQLLGDVLAGPGVGPVAAIVARIQGNPVSPVAPLVGQALVWNGAAWLPTTLPSGAPVGPAQCVFVDPVAGNDGTGQRGRADLPFLTIAAAIGAVIALDDCIVLAPGEHSVSATLPEPLVGRISFVGYGRDVTTVSMDSGGGFLPLLSCGVTLVERLAMRNFTIRLATGDIGIVADGSLGNGDFMREGLELSGVRFERSPGAAPVQGWVFTAVNRLVIENVQVDGGVSFNTCHSAPSLSQDPSLLQNLSVLTNTYIAWDDDVAQAFGFPMGREPMRFRECSLGEVLLDLQPDVQPERCSYRGLTSLNPLGNSSTGVASIWSESDCIVGSGGGLTFIDFTASQFILDVPVSPTFLFTRPHWNGLVVCAFERLASVNGRTTPRISDLSGPGSFSLFICNEGIDGNIFSANIMPTISIGGSGTFTPGVWRPIIAFGPTVAGPNFFPFPWGPAGSGNNWIVVQPDNFVPGEVLTAGPGGALGFNVDAAIGGGFFYAEIGWVNGS